MTVQRQKTEVENPWESDSPTNSSREKVAANLQQARRNAVARISHSNVWLMQGRYATEKDGQERLKQLASCLRKFR